MSRRTYKASLLEQEEEPEEGDGENTQYTFESIQLHLDVVKSLREQAWSMRRKLETLRYLPIPDGRRERDWY